jgi:hypothetical protein
MSCTWLAGRDATIWAANLHCVTISQRPCGWRRCCLDVPLCRGQRSALSELLTTTERDDLLGKPVTNVRRPPCELAPSSLAACKALRRRPATATKLLSARSGGAPRWRADCKGYLTRPYGGLDGQQPSQLSTQPVASPGALPRAWAHTSPQTKQTMPAHIMVPTASRFFPHRPASTRLTTTLLQMSPSIGHLYVTTSTPSRVE